MIKTIFIRSVAIALSISTAFSAGNFSIEVLHEGFEENSTLITDIVYHNNTIHFETKLPTEGETWGSTPIPFYFPQENIEFIATRLIFNQSGSRLMLYTEHDIDKDSALLSLTIMTTPHNIIINPINEIPEHTVFLSNEFQGG